MDAAANLLRLDIGQAGHAQATGIGYRGHQLRRDHHAMQSAHARQDDGIADTEQVTNRSVQVIHISSMS